MKRIALSLLSVALVAGAIAPDTQAATLESTPTASRFDQLRRENLDKDPNSLDELIRRQTQGGKNVDFDQLRRENLDKDQNSLDALIRRQTQGGKSVDFDQLRRENLDKDHNNFDQLRRENLEKGQNNFDELSNRF